MFRLKLNNQSTFIDIHRGYTQLSMDVSMGHYIYFKILTVNQINSPEAVIHDLLSMSVMILFTISGLKPNFKATSEHN